MDIISVALGFFMCMTCVLLYDKFTVHKPKKIEVDKEEIEKQDKMNEHLSKMMNYDYHQAIGGGKRG